MGFSWVTFVLSFLFLAGDILHQGGVGSGGVQGRGQGHGEDGADREVPHVSIKEEGSQAYFAGLKRADAHVSWEGGGPIW